MAPQDRVCFPALRFSAAGEYRFTVGELTKTDGAWDCDGRRYPVVVKVTADKKGRLKAKVRYPAGFPVFVNRKYRPPPATCPAVCSCCHPDNV